MEIAGVSSLDMADSLFYEQLDIYMKIFLILYADYTLLCPESLDGMRSMLDEISNYCTIWKLEGIISITKVVIFSKRKYRPEVKLKLNGIELDYTDAYLYVGVYFIIVLIIVVFTLQKKKLVEESQKALYAVYYKI